MVTKPLERRIINIVARGEVGTYTRSARVVRESQVGLLGQRLLVNPTSKVTNSYTQALQAYAAVNGGGGGLKTSSKSVLGSVLTALSAKDILLSASTHRKFPPHNSNQESVVTTLHGDREIDGKPAFNPSGGDKWFAAGTDDDSSTGFDAKLFSFLNAGSNRQSLINILSDFDSVEQQKFMRSACGNDSIKRLPEIEKAPSRLRVAEAIVDYLGVHTMNDVVNLLRVMRALNPNWNGTSVLDQCYTDALQGSDQFNVLTYDGGVITEPEIMDGLKPFSEGNLTLILTDRMGCQVVYGSKVLQLRDQIVAAVRQSPARAQALLNVLEKSNPTAVVTGKLRASVSAAQRAAEPPKPVVSEGLQEGHRKLLYLVDADFGLTRGEIAQPLLRIAQYLPTAITKFCKDEEGLGISAIVSDNPVELLNHVFAEINRLKSNRAQVLIRLLHTSADVAASGQTSEIARDIGMVRRMAYRIQQAVNIEEMATTPLTHYHGAPVLPATLTSVVDGFVSKDQFSAFVGKYRARNGSHPYAGFALVHPSAEIVWDKFRQRLIDAFVAQPTLIGPFIVAAGEWQGGSASETNRAAQSAYGDLLQSVYGNAVGKSPSVVPAAQSNQSLKAIGLEKRDGDFVIGDRVAFTQWLDSTSLTDEDFRTLAASFPVRFNGDLPGTGTSRVRVIDNFVDILERRGTSAREILAVLKRSRKITDPKLDAAIAAMDSQPARPPFARTSGHTVSTTDNLVRQFRDFESPLRTRLGLLGPVVMPSASGLAQVLQNIRLQVPAGLQGKNAPEAWPLAINAVQMYRGSGVFGEEEMVAAFFNQILISLPSESAKKIFLDLLEE